MTASVWTPTDCPKCRSGETVELDGNVWLCLACRHEWNVTTVTEDDYAAVVVGGTVDAPTEWSRNPVAIAPGVVLEGSPSGARLRSLDRADDREAPAHIAAARSRYLGTVVELAELAVSGVVVEITGDGFAVVELTEDHDVIVLPDEFKVTDATVIADETVTALATTDMAIAAQVLRAGAATIELRGETRTLGMPPDGWLPDDPGVMPVIEHGCAYAIAILATTAGISTDDLTALAARLDDAADAAKGADTNGGD